MCTSCCVRWVEGAPAARWKGVREWKGAKDSMRVHLRENDATQETRKKIRLRRPSAYAEYELRFGDVRVFYRVRDELIEVVLIGVKEGNRLFIGGEEFEI